MAENDWYERERLHRAAETGDVGTLRALIDAGHDLNVFDELGYAPLHYAAHGEQLDAVRYLLSAGALVDAQDEARAGDTPLGHVAQKCSAELAQILLEAGADPPRPGAMQVTPVERASRRKRGDGPEVHRLLSLAASKRRS